MTYNFRRTAVVVADLVAATVSATSATTLLVTAACRIFKDGFVVGIATIPAKPAAEVAIIPAVWLIAFAASALWLAVRRVCGPWELAQ